MCPEALRIACHDVSSMSSTWRRPDRERRIEAVRRVLQDIGIEARRWCLQPNGPPWGTARGDAMARRHDGIPVSALHRTGLRRLLAWAERMLWADGTGVPNLPPREDEAEQVSLT